MAFYLQAEITGDFYTKLFVIVEAFSGIYSGFTLIYFFF